MRMRRILTVVVVVLVMVGGMAATGVAGNSDGGVNRWEVIVIGNLETERYYDWGWTLNEEVETTDGEHLGWSGGPCMQLSPDPEALDRFYCDLGMRLPDGDIIFGGPIDLNEWFEGETVFAVNGGTGKFRNISGEVRIIPAEDFSHSRLIFRVKNAKASY
jgi:hypothetical protein